MANAPSPTPCRGSSPAEAIRWPRGRYRRRRVLRDLLDPSCGYPKCLCDRERRPGARFGRASRSAHRRSRAHRGEGQRDRSDHRSKGCDRGRPRGDPRHRHHRPSHCGSGICLLGPRTARAQGGGLFDPDDARLARNRASPSDEPRKPRRHRTVPAAFAGAVVVVAIAALLIREAFDPTGSTSPPPSVAKKTFVALRDESGDVAFSDDLRHALGPQFRTGPIVFTGHIGTPQAFAWVPVASPIEPRASAWPRPHAESGPRSRRGGPARSAWSSPEGSPCEGWA
jgi:hypothetical protein